MWINGLSRFRLQNSLRMMRMIHQQRGENRCMAFLVQNDILAPVNPRRSPFFVVSTYQCSTFCDAAQRSAFFHYSVLHCDEQLSRLNYSFLLYSVTNKEMSMSIHTKCSLHNTDYKIEIVFIQVCIFCL